jgi:NDP-sugar pyrophosphorylase family protein
MFQMKSAIVLAAGKGRKIWPYSEVRSKTMIRVSNKPILAYSIEALLESGFDDIIIVASDYIEEIRNYFAGTEGVSIVYEKAPRGTAFSALFGLQFIKNEKFLLLYGDTILSKQDIQRLWASAEQGKLPSALLAPITEQVQNYICCDMINGEVGNIKGHPRDECTHFFAGFAFDSSMETFLRNNSGRFTNIQVGMMPPQEGYLEMSLADYITSGHRVAAIEVHEEVYDIDKPWHILMANKALNRKKCSELTHNILASGAEIDSAARIKGYISLGKNSRIGPNVFVGGNIIVGDNTVIDNGAILNGNIIIGNDCLITHYCYIEEDSTICDRCVINHYAELSGIAMPGSYLYHYMHVYGIIGENADLGAATVCGSLRFDDGETTHRILGRKEIPKDYSDACYIGDYCRTGVNAMLMPGVKMGAYSIVGAGVLLEQDLPSKTLVYTKQELHYKPWNSDKYGW